MNALIIIIIGIIIIYVGFEWIKKNRHLLKIGIRTIGTVVSTSSEKSTSIKDKDGLYETVYYSTVKFTTKDKRTLEVELLHKSVVKDPIGFEKKLIYDPQYPQEVRLINQFNMVIGPWLFLGCGAILFLWGILELSGVTDIVQ